MDNVRYDVDGYEMVTEALQTLIKQFPGFAPNEKFSFSTLTWTGVGIFPSSGAIIGEERESITGHVTQTCQYPFTVVYRVSGLTPKRKVSVKEWLDSLGRWLEMQPVMIDGVEHKLTAYPKLKGAREIRNIFRQTPAVMNAPNEDKSEDWMIDMMIQYRNEFDK